MNVTDCASRLLSYFSPEERSIPDSPQYPGRNAAVKSAINAALQDLYGKGQPWVRNDDRGVMIYPPEVITIDVTEGSTIATIASGQWRGWFAGCTIVIDGSEVDNRIQNSSPTVKLKFPYVGPSGNHSATVYHDSIDLDPDVLELHEPVKFNRAPLGSRLPSNPGTRRSEDFGGRTSISFPSVAQSAGTPSRFWAETFPPDNETPARIRLGLTPAPLSSGFLEYSVMLCPPFVDDLSSSSSLPVPFGWIDSIFMPIAVKHLRHCPFWRGIMGEEEVQMNYGNALDLLNGKDPNKSSRMTFTPPF